MKVIFLDIDGVLNSKEFALSDRNTTPGIIGMDPVAIRLLQNIILKTNCKVVVSSSWRILHMDDEDDFFYEELALHDTNNIIKNSIIGTTPIGYNHEVLRGTKYVRGDEIKAWIDDNNFKGRFVIIDDNSDMGNLLQHLVKTSYEYGLTEEISNEVIKRLT